jgi:succinate dehydrogenase / fumarate reductase cytochrome b subunit
MLIVHVSSAIALTRMNQTSRPSKYQSQRRYIAADFAGRSMRWTGIIVFFYLLYHLADLTFGWANPDYIAGDVYGNVVASFDRLPIAILYVIANILLAIHLYHGGWSMFQSLGVNSPRYNGIRRGFAITFAAIIGIANVSFPIAVQVGIVG